MNSPEATIILKSPDGAWTTIGTEASRGIVPEGINASANESGPDTCSFSLRREASVPWPDLLAFNKADVYIGGQLLWGGRIWEAPLSDADEDVIAVQGRGHQYHLDDALIQRMYVMTDMTRYVDQRSLAEADISGAAGGQRAGAQVQAGAGAIALVFPNQYPVTNNEQVVATFDAGASLIVRAVVSWERIGSNDPDDTVRSRGRDGANAAAAGDDATAVLTSASGTISHTFAALRRYHHIMVFRNGATSAFGSDQGAKITAINLFGSTAYESGGVSVLKASQVFTDVLASGALPLLDPSTAKIETTAFSIPDFAPSGYQTPRALMAAANAYEGNLFGVTAERLLFLRERDEVPLTEVGSWPGSSFQDASTNSAEGLYNKVIVQGTGPSGAPISVARFSSDVASTPESAFADVAGLANPGFETDTSSWTTITGTLTRVTGTDAGMNVFSEGAAAGRLTTTAPPATVAVSTTLSNLTVGALHAVRFDYRRAANTSPVTVIGEVTSGGTVLGRAAHYNPLAPQLPFVQLQASFVATATTATLTISVNTSAFSTDIIFFDAVHVYKVRASLLDRQGFVRTATLSVDAALTETSATQLGDIWLNERVNPPLKGSLVVSGWGGARYVNGGDVHPSEFLLRYGQRIRLGQLVDPSTGDQGRDGIIKSVSYSHDTETASLELDSERGRLETLLSRLAVVTGQIR